MIIATQADPHRRTYVPEVRLGTLLRLTIRSTGNGNMASDDAGLSTPGTSVVTELSPAPSDGVTRVCFNSSGSRLLSSTWGGSVAIHCSSTGHLIAEGSQPQKCALLDACWCDDQIVAVAALDGRVLTSPVTLSSWTELGSHSAASRSVVHCAARSLLVSAGWDGKLRLWDARAAAPAAGETDLGSKCFGLARYGAECVVAITSERRVCIADLRKRDEFVHDKVPSALSYQLRGISANEAGDRYVVGSTEGRVAVEWPLESKRGYSFRCHRLDGLAFPINDIAHNTKYGSFATGGGDGHVSLWDAEGKKRISQYAKQATSIASLDFSPDSSRMAVAVSYTFEEGEKDHPPDSIHIRDVKDAEIRLMSQ